MKRILSIVLVLLLTTYNISFGADLDLSGESAILIDGDSGQILFEKNSHEKLYPASTTKIMTGILALELGNMNDTVVIDDEIVQLTDGSHIALEPGERVNFEDLLYGVMVQSANDAALAIAKHVGGDIDKFVGLMNDKAKEIGAMDTHFVNPNGLPHDDHVTTAYDLSLIGQYAMKNPEFRQIVGNWNYQIPTSNKKDEVRHLNSNNRLLYSSRKIDVNGQIKPIKYEGATGMKTGYTVAAQNCLVASATRGNQNLIAVILKANGREVFSDAHKLFDCGFGDYKKISIAAKGEFVDNIELSEGITPTVIGAVEDDLFTCVPKDLVGDVEKIISLNEDIHAPIGKGQALGSIKYYMGDRLLGEANIVSTLDVEQNMVGKTDSKLGGKWKFALAFLLVLGLFRVYLVRKRKKRRLRIQSLYKMGEHIR